MTGLHDSVPTARDLAAQEVTLAFALEIRDPAAVARAQVRYRVDGAMAARALDLDRVVHLRPDVAVAHHVGRRVAVDAVHAALVVNVGWRQVGVSQIERAVQQLVGRAFDVGAGRHARHQLRHATE